EQGRLTNTNTCYCLSVHTRFTCIYPPHRHPINDVHKITSRITRKVGWHATCARCTSAKNSQPQSQDNNPRSSTNPPPQHLKRLDQLARPTIAPPLPSPLSIPHNHQTRLDGNHGNMITSP
ncbi:unnamed protein product, partial [Ectocarpus sp. 13 AM-2016]